MILIIIKRVAGLPFFAGLLLVALFALWLKACLNFLRFGGEAIAYTQKNERKAIADIYDKLVEDSENE